MNTPGFNPSRTSDEKPNYDRPIDMPPAKFEKSEPKPAWGANLPPEVAAKYELITIHARRYTFKGFGEIDLRRITLEEADDLHRRGFPFLVEKSK